MIGECCCGEVTVSPKAVCTLPEYPTTEYCKFVFDSLSNISSPNLTKLLTVKSLIEESIIKLAPFGTTLIFGDSVYPMPGLIIFTSLKLSF